MAETLNVSGIEVKKRHPFGPLGLGIITLGIYTFVWYYKINKELHEYTGEGNPTTSLMAMLFGWIIIVPPFVSMYKTGERIVAAQGKAGLAERIAPILVLVLAIVPIANFFWSFYVQKNLNEVWDAASGRAA